MLCDNVIFQLDKNGSTQNQKSCDGIINGLAVNNGSNELYSVGSFNSNIVFNIYDNTINQTAATNFTGDAGSGNVYAMASDHSGNIYVYGSVWNCDYYGREIESGTFFAKHQPNGELLWIKAFPGANGQSSSMGDYVYVDKKNDFVYVTGLLTDDLVIPGVSTLTAGDQDAFFLLKFDLEGNLISTIKEDIPLEEPAVVADEEGQVIITGHFSEDFQFKGQLYTMVGYEKNGFMIKYNEKMEYRWSKHLKGNYVDYFYIQAVDQDNNIYLSGEVYSDTLMIGNHEMILPEYEGNIILVKMKANGEIVWAKTTARAYNDQSSWDNWPTGLKVSSDGYVYMKGWHGDSVYFDNILLTIPNDYRYSYFVAKFDLNGNVIWAKSITEEYRGFDYNQFDLDNDGNVYFGAQASGDLQFGDDFYYDNAGSLDLFVAKYNSNGDLDWVQTMAGQGSSYNWISSVAVGGEDDVYVSGYFSNRLEFGGLEINTQASRHGFITRLSNAVGVPVYTRPVGNFTISPNPSDGRIKIKGEKIKGNNMVVLNALGQQVHSFEMDQNEKNFDLTWLSSGLYFVKVVGNHEFRTNKFIIE